MFPGMVSSSSSCTSGYVIGYVCKWICKYNLRGCIIHLASLPMCFVLFELLFWTVYHSYICICDIPLLSSDLDTKVRLTFVWDRGFCCISTFWWLFLLLLAWNSLYYLMGINVASFYHFYIWCWNCSDNMVFLFFCFSLYYMVIY